MTASLHHRKSEGVADYITDGSFLFKRLSNSLQWTSTPSYITLKQTQFNHIQPSIIWLYLSFTTVSLEKKKGLC